MRLQDHQEIEFKLSVTGGDLDAILEDVASLRSLAGLALDTPRRHHLHDVYWDLSNGSVHEHGLSLRLRHIDDRVLFTVKGGTSSHDGLFLRDELELPATRESWATIRREFAERGVALRDDGQRTSAGRAGVTTSDPMAWLAAAGLVVTQDRRTERTVRNALRAGVPVAELALDRTRYDFGHMQVDYHEIEIEQIGAGDGSLARRLGEALVKRYPDRLEPSTMGKYRRGLKLERSLRDAGRL
ncbi:MAG: CYTH domain-containing protein [Chloroflexi bacterium]|nr:CYTH domain-containing protein [Chloroflexota bacterium]